MDDLSLRKITITDLSPELQITKTVHGETINHLLKKISNYFIHRKMEILMIILLIIIFIIILTFTNKKDPYLETFNPILSEILKKSGYHTIPIHLRRSKNKTYTIDKQKIFLVTHKQNGERYNRDTLLFVLLHEIAHILSPNEHHTKDFHRIEKRLHSTAIDLGYIRKDRLDKTYPCHQ